MNNFLILSKKVKKESFINFGFQVSSTKSETELALEKDIPCLSCLKDGKNEIHFPYNMSFEVYYANFEGALYLSLDLADLANELKSTLSNEQRLKLYSNWTCDTGKTIYQGISRVKPGDILDVDTKQFHRKKFVDYTQKDPTCFKEFKDSITASIEGYVSKTDKVGVLFSGGADSLLVCLTLDRLGIPFVCYTAFPKQSFDSAIDDKFKAASMASYFGWEHKLVEVDFDKHVISDIKDFVINMPQSVHLGIYFKTLVEQAKCDDITVLFSGQNMDSLYNLGPTTLPEFSKSAIADFIRRCFLNTTYFRLLQNNGVVGLVSKLLAFGSALPFSMVYSLFKRKVYVPSWSKFNVISAYQTSTDYSTFRKYGSKRSIKSTSIGEVKSSLLDYKIENFLMTGAPQVIHTSCRLSGIKSALPFSTEKMIKTFYRLPLEVKDILHPKYYVYGLIEDYAGKKYSDIRKACSFGAKPDYCGLDYQSWCQKILPRTNFGKTLYLAVEDSDFNGSTPAQQLMDRLARYWVKVQIGQQNVDK